jgi:phospholipid/cholesterol/gamma-HCH transport system ATP-binding protein
MRNRHERPNSSIDVADDDHVVLERVHKSYGSVSVLSDINVRFKRHKTAVIIGGSGSGKTTLARLIVALTPVTSGRIWVNGVDITQLRERPLMKVRRLFGMVFQHHALLQSMTVLDNVAFPLREHHPAMAASEVEGRVVSALEGLGLFHKERRLPTELSGGEQKRVAVARALILQPELVVYDEPTSGLDPDTARAVDHIIVETQKKHQVTSVVITHDIATCFRIADRVHVLERGRLVAEGTAHELASRDDPAARMFFDDSGVTEAQLAKIEPA